MDAERHARGKELFEEALQLPREERSAFVERACAEDGVLRNELLELLAHHEQSEGFLSGRARLPEPARELPLDGFQLRGYRLERVLGRGGMGIVYLAEQESPRRPVALKFLRLDTLEPGQVARFRREAEILGRLNHPGIAHVHEAGLAETPHGALPWIALEYVRGLPLCEHVASRAPDLRDLLELFGELCEAVEHAHQRGIVHRDLKPSNVLVDERGAVRVLDFGVARLVAGGGGDGMPRTRTGQFVGTLAYASPEQALGASASVDARSDVYSLGVMLFELVTGELPYPVEEDHVLAAIQTITASEPRRLRRLRPDAPADLETIVRKALDKEPERRYASAGELAADLERLRAERPIRAQPATAFYQVRKFVRRNRLLSASAAAVILALSVAVAALHTSGRRVAAQLVATSETLDLFAGEMFHLVPVVGFGEDHRGALELLEGKLGEQLVLDPENRALRATRARALYELGTLDHLRADNTPAEQRFELARALREELARDPADVESRLQLSQVYAKLGEVARERRDHAAKEGWFQRALEVSEALVREHPGNGEVVEALGWSLERVADLAITRGDLASARPLVERRLADALGLVERAPDDWKSLYNAAQAHVQASALAMRTGPETDVEAHRRAALQLALRLSELQPRRADFVHLCASMSLSIGHLEGNRGLAEEALVNLERAYLLGRQLFLGDRVRGAYADVYSSSASTLSRLLFPRDPGRARSIPAQVRTAAGLAREGTLSRLFLLAHADVIEATQARDAGDPAAEELAERASETFFQALIGLPTTPEDVAFVAKVVGEAFLPARRAALCQRLAATAPALARELAEQIESRAGGSVVALLGEASAR